MINAFRFFSFILILTTLQLTAQTKKNFEALDVFQLEYANDPQISPDGNTVVYRRTGFDIMKDGSKGDLWLLSSDGRTHEKLTSREVDESQGRWSPSGDRIAFVSKGDHGSEIYVYWMVSERLPN
jgi:Tol biopolymer transport system component